MVTPARPRLPSCQFPARTSYLSRGVLRARRCARVREPRALRPRELSDMALGTGERGACALMARCAVGEGWLRVLSLTREAMNRPPRQSRGVLRPWGWRCEPLRASLQWLLVLLWQLLT